LRKLNVVSIENVYSGLRVFTPPDVDAAAAALVVAAAGVQPSNCIFMAEYFVSS